MKKTYLTPSVEMIEMQSEPLMLGISETERPGTDALAPEAFPEPESKSTNFWN